MPDNLHSITTLDDLLDWLGDELDWPIEDYGLDDLTFEYDADDLGLREEDARKLEGSSIRQLRPLTGGQPFGIFFVEFSRARLPVVVLRRILNALVVKKRASANPADLRRWNPADLIFISAFGEDDNREIAFAHFHRNPDTTEIPVLHVLGWNGSTDTPLKLEHVVGTLKQRLCWPEDTANHDDWRTQWTGAFRHRLGHVIRTASDLAETLAVFARKIRDAATTIMAHESETKGQLRKLHRAFKSALIHDLSEADFADMYAQTVTYGLLTAAISRTERSEGRHGTALTPDDITAMVPVTNPFLKEMLQDFLTAGGRSGGIDFDELGINEVVELLRGNETDLPAILRDFGNRRPSEDPVIYFYEEFLKAYNAELKIERGVFYTPQPVVSYIVRSVHELLQTEFDLEDGLASTVTWGEMLEKHPDLKLPLLTDLPGETKTVLPDEPFVQILDPATGTATFLVEVIDAVHKHLSRKWQTEGLDAARRKDAWNAYVPEHLLPRLHGYELMMAPYAIAHMKIGLKLAETGYRFDRDARARVYLTNALEPVQSVSGLLDFAIPALAHEAQAVNEVKVLHRFTVVLGNPPYSGHSANKGDWVRKLLRGVVGNEQVESYFTVDGSPLNERNPKWLNDDYVKFIRLAHWQIERTGRGVVGFITNHRYLDNPTFRGMRESLITTFPRMYLLDLHGNAKRRERAPDGSKDENVFDIQQGVAIGLFTRAWRTDQRQCNHADLWGSRGRKVGSGKYGYLVDHDVSSTAWNALFPRPSLRLFVPHDETLHEEYEAGWSLTNIFPVNSVGIATARDKLAIQWTAEDMDYTVADFATRGTEEARTVYNLGMDAQDWQVHLAQEDVRTGNGHVCPIMYRPFDRRFTFYTGNSRGFICRPRPEVMQHMLAGGNLGLSTTRSIEIADGWEHVFVSSDIIQLHTVSLKEVNYLFPLYTHLPGAFDQREPNLDPNFRSAFAAAVNLDFIFEGAGDLTATFGPEDILHYLYTVLHSPEYRRRYADFLKSDFPRLPLTSSLALFRALAGLGGELVALHLLESPILDTPRAKFMGSSRRINKVGWTPDNGGTVWIDGKGSKADFKSGASGFCPVPGEVWNFHIGGYQVCEKWLKDRGPKKGNSGRTLTDEDIAHYQRIIIALTETIRLMAEIDERIESYGGWPDAFLTSDETED